MIPISVRWHFNHHKNAQNSSDQFPMNKGIVPAKFTAFFCGDNFMFICKKIFQVPHISLHYILEVAKDIFGIINHSMNNHKFKSNVKNKKPDHYKVIYL